MGLFKKKKPAAEETVNDQVKAAMPADAEIIDPAQVKKAEQGSVRNKKSGGYNWIYIRRLRRWQRVAIIGCVVFMLGTLFVTGRINGSRQDELKAMAASLQNTKNELVKLQTTGDVVTEIKTDTSMYHSKSAQELDDLRVTELLNGMLRWESPETREIVRGTAESQYHPDATFLSVMFSAAGDYAGYRYSDDDRTLAGRTEMNAVSNFVSSMTGMVAGVSRSYNAILDFTYGSNDGHLYTRKVLVSYVVYEEGTVGGLTAYNLSNGVMRNE